MRTFPKMIGLAMSFCGISLFAADSPFIGTWKLNADRVILEGHGSRVVHDAVMKYDMDTSGNLIRTLDGFDGQFRPIRNEDKIEFNRCDGVEHPLDFVITSLTPGTPVPRIEISAGRVPLRGVIGDDLLISHYPYGPPGSLMTTSCVHSPVTFPS
jgi:hypothetical protein